MKKALTLVVVLAMASAAQAAIIGSSGGDIDVVVTDLGAVSPCLGSTALHAYQVDLVDVGATVDSLNAIDLQITGQLHQQWDYFRQDIPSPDNDNLVLGYLPAPQVDTHFLIGPSGAQNWQAVVSAAAEDNDGSCGLTPAPGLEGFGTFLSAISSIAPAGNIALAYVVVPEGGSAMLTGTCSDSTGEVFPLNVPIPIPEPATMSLLALAGLGLVARKRR